LLGIPFTWFWGILGLVLCTSVIFIGAAMSQPGQETFSEPSPADFLSPEVRQQVGALIVQDFQGRMKPLDTLTREMVRKISKRNRMADRHPLDLVLGWLAAPRFWFEYPLLAVRFPGLKQVLGLSAETTHVGAVSLFDTEGQYRLAEMVEEALRTPDERRSKLQRKLLAFDERFNLLYMGLQGITLRLYPVPGDSRNTWVDATEIQGKVPEEFREPFQQAALGFLEGLRSANNPKVSEAASAIAALQKEFGEEVLPSTSALRSEILLNRLEPFTRVLIFYLLGFVLLILAFVWTLARRGGLTYNLRHPLYLLGSFIFVGALLFHLLGFVLRWIASARAPLSNGYESLIFIGLMVAVAGLIFEIKDRRGAASGLASLLTTVILGVSMMSAFDPAIGPLVPVLDSYWLNIHVTVITGSYGFLGLGALLGCLVLILHLLKGPGRSTIREGVKKIDRLNHNVLVTGLALLSLGTLLGGVWANESWGRYWGWDPKETWSFVTICVYVLVLHLRWIPALNRPWVLAAGSFSAIASVLMTYFGVNYFLTGLHSYAQGEATGVPTWVYVTAGIMLTLIAASGWFERNRSWGESPTGVTSSVRV
jgi:cytochrome c-type biogenesis protein CcsB